MLLLTLTTGRSFSRSPPLSQPLGDDFLDAGGDVGDVEEESSLEDEVLLENDFSNGFLITRLVLLLLLLLDSP